MTLQAAPPLPVMQRSHGRGALAVKLSAGATRIDRLHQAGNAKIRIPKTYGAALEAVLINTSGGITGGDTLDWSIVAGARTCAVVTTQACERIYRSTGDTGRQTARLSVEAGARLFWLPQETIVFEGGRIRRELEVDLAADARFLALESFVFGREAMGETVNRAFVHDRWRIRRDGALVHGDDLRFDLSETAGLTGAAMLGENRAVATLVSLAPDDAETLDRMVAEARALLDGATAGVSRIGHGAHGKIVLRVAAPSAYLLRRRLLPVIALFLDGLTLPKVWSL